MVAVKFDTILGSFYVNGGVVVSEQTKSGESLWIPPIGWKMSLPPTFSSTEHSWHKPPAHFTCRAEDLRNVNAA